MSRGSRRNFRSARSIALVGLALISVAGCACRPGYVGPYGGIHPTRCWVW